MIQVPKEEFLCLKREITEMKERLEILMDRELMAQLVESEKDIKRSSEVKEKATKSIREIRDEMWQECLKEADNNEDLAWDILHEKYCR